MAAVLAESGFQVSGVDVSKETVEAVNTCEPAIFEPGLKELMRSVRNRLSATDNCENAVVNSEVTFIVVPTPSDKEGGFSLKYVKQAMHDVGLSLAKTKSYHLVVLTSTVMPGAMDKTIRPELEAASGRTCGKEFGLCYNPEFIALGDVLNGLRKPDFVLIGESDPKAGALLASLQERICTVSPPMRRMSFVNAEIAKIAVNSFVTMKISFANTLAELAENVPGADVDTITSAVGEDKRIGGAYLKGALGFGGPCFPRDNIAFAHFARGAGVAAPLAVATQDINLRQASRLVSLLKNERIRPPAKVGVLGLAYKPNTNVVEASQALIIVQELANAGFEVRAYDPAAIENARPVLRDMVTFERSAKNCVTKSDICVLATPWPEFKRLDPALFKNKTVVDCWRFFGTLTVKQARKNIVVGRALSRDPTRT